MIMFTIAILARMQWEFTQITKLKAKQNKTKQKQNLKTITRRERGREKSSEGIYFVFGEPTVPAKEIFN